MRRIRASVPQAITEALSQANEAKLKARQTVNEEVALAVQREVSQIVETSELDVEAQAVAQGAVKRAVAPSHAGSFSDGAFSMMRRGGDVDELYSFPHQTAPKRIPRHRAPAPGLAMVYESGATVIDQRARAPASRTTPLRPAGSPD